ncbi:hypothetical protein GIB67_042389 [Kingdonia uniflora]|uniref:Carboxypeptidase n=1 Tax=Kingdonia uniflora TaxID=39325 RepID=A0A7J7M8E7_9MAGN|nr:hypothetical protein GIB67_042389 [Kingdonia uniflora]
MKVTLAISSIVIYILCFSMLRINARQEDALALLKLKRRTNFDASLVQESELAVNEVKIFSQKGLKEKDLIEMLPGQPHVTFTQYGGYVTIDETAGRAFYYYFTEAELPKGSKPLLLWLNGGPGCSSLAYGAMEELGPFRVHSDGKTLYPNPYAWNKVANVLFLESPAGVGFSYSNRTSDYDKSGDKMTADDNYLFLVNWLERFPEYKNREFYISGESFAGHYVPQLAQTILQHNKNSNNNTINLKGIIIGNACLNWVTDDLGVYDYLWTHAIISDEAINNIHKYCKYPIIGDEPDRCSDGLDEVDNNTKSMDTYNIYAPLCLDKNLTDTPKETSIFNFDPCSDHYVYAYLNNPDVQKALHANVTKLNYEWSSCSKLLKDWVYSSRTMLPILKELMANRIRVWVYSGDTDSVVPVTSTRYSLNLLNLTSKTPWYPWSVESELGGFALEYKGEMTFATVRGAGHEVPSYQPLRALALIKHFLDGTPLPRAQPQE